MGVGAAGCRIPICVLSCFSFLATNFSASSLGSTTLVAAALGIFGGLVGLLPVGLLVASVSGLKLLLVAYFLVNMLVLLL